MAESLVISLAISTAVGFIGSLLTPKKKPTLPDIPGSQYGKTLIRGFGTFAVEGNMIFPETANQAFRISRSRSKGGKGIPQSQSERVYGKFMAVFCQGQTTFDTLWINGVTHGGNGSYDGYMTQQGFDFFDGRPLTINGGAQLPWSDAQAINGANNTPAYTGLTCAAFSNLDLTKLGNTFPTQFKMKLVDVELGAEPSLGAVVKAICKLSGLSDSQVDTSDLAGFQIVGFVMDQSGGSYKDSISQLASAWLFYHTELQDGTLAFRFFDRSFTGDSPLIIPADELGAYDGVESNFPFNIRRDFIDPLELPSKIWLTFTNPNIGFYRDTVVGEAQWAKHKNELNIDCSNCIMTAGQAITQVSRMMQQFWVQRNKFKFTLPPVSPSSGFKYINLSVGNLLELPTGEVVQIEKIDIGLNYIVEIVAHGYGKSSSITAGSGSSSSVSPPRSNSEYTDNIPVGSTSNKLTILDINTISDSDSERGVYVTASGSNVNVLVSIDNGTSYSKATTLTTPGIVVNNVTGTLISWSDTTATDTTSTLTIPQSVGTISSITSGQAATLTENVAFVGSTTTVNGTSVYRGEIVVFTTVTVSGSNYVLSNFTRGVRGTESYMSTHGTNTDTFVLLNGVGANVSRISIDDQYIGTNLYFQTTNNDWQTSYSDPSATQFSYQAIGLKPYQQKNIAFNYDSAQNIVISWTKVPRGMALTTGELIDSYSLDILNNSNAVVRTLTSASPVAIYSKAQQITDFGSVQTSLKVNLYKVSSIVGRGYVRSLSTTVASAGSSTSIVGDTSTDSFKATKTITANYTVLTTDNGYWIVVNNASLTGSVSITITVSNALPLGFRCYFVNPLPVSGNNVILTFVSSTSEPFYTTNTLKPDSVGLLYFHGSSWTLNSGKAESVGGSGFTDIEQLRFLL